MKRKILGFAVYDDYENDMELLGIYKTPAEAKAAKEERIEDTDGECEIYIKRIYEKEAE